MIIRRVSFGGHSVFNLHSTKMLDCIRIPEVSVKMISEFFGLALDFPLMSATGFGFAEHEGNMRIWARFFMTGASCSIETMRIGQHPEVRNDLMFFPQQGPSLVSLPGTLCLT